MDAALPSAKLYQRGLDLLVLVAVNALSVVGVVWFRWHAAEVLLIYWVETLLLVSAAPLRAWARYGDAGLKYAASAALGNGVFLAFHAFFLMALLYGVDWENVEGGPGGWSAPTKGSLADWFSLALADLPLLALVAVVAIKSAALGSELPRLRRLRQTEPKLEVSEMECDAGGRVIIMHIAIVFGGSMILAAGGAIGMLMLLIVLKTAYDLFGWVRNA